jgi:hypothetical protein
VPFTNDDISFNALGLILNKQQWIDHFQPNWSVDWRGWDWSMTDYLFNNNLSLLICDKSRTKNIGVIGVHTREEFFNEYLKDKEHNKEIYSDYTITNLNTSKQNITKLLVKFPTRGRRDKFFNTLNTYYEYLSNKYNVHFLITLDSDDTEMNNVQTMERLNIYKNLTYYYGDSKTKIEAVNTDLDKTDWDIVLLASDDMIPIVHNYDEIIINKMQEYYPDMDGVLWFNDGHQGNNLNTLCILGKKYYDRFGYIYYPEYKSLWCDTEFTEVATILNKQIYFKDTIIKHEHFSLGFGYMDSLDVKNTESNSTDKIIFSYRKLINFNI